MKPQEIIKYFCAVTKEIKKGKKNKRGKKRDRIGGDNGNELS